MPLSRRASVGLIGGGVVLAATAPTVGFVVTRTPGDALAPWDKAGRYADLRMRALSYALLAPNPHNRQPWVAELVGNDGVRLYRDPKRNLPVTDPFARQLTIGMGCFIELMELAAAEEGYGVSTRLYPTGETGPVAECRFMPGAGKPNPLFAHVMRRRSHKGAFETRAVPAETVRELSAHARILTEGDDLAAARRIAHAAWLKECGTPAAWQESIDLLRIGKAEINANPDGIHLSGAMIEAMALMGLVSRQRAADANDPGSRSVIERTSNAILAAPAMTVSLSKTNTRADQIEAGRQWLRLNLAATGLQLALRPVSQALQEYAEMKPLYDEIHTRLARGQETVQMLGILGYGQVPPRTPRWSLETRIKHA